MYIYRYTILSLTTVLLTNVFFFFCLFQVSNHFTLCKISRVQMPTQSKRLLFQVPIRQVGSHCECWYRVNSIKCFYIIKRTFPKREFRIQNTQTGYSFQKRYYWVCITDFVMWNFIVKGIRNRWKCVFYAWRFKLHIRFCNSYYYRQPRIFPSIMPIPSNIFVYIVCWILSKSISNND